MEPSQTSPARLSRLRIPVIAACAVMAASVLSACSSTQTIGQTHSSSAGPPIPASAFHDTTGVTAKTVTIGNVTTEVAGLFTGAVVGTEAYAAYVNSQGGVNGRTIIVHGVDDGFAGATNKQATQYALQNDFAIVGSVSLEDSFGGTVIAANPQLPDVSASLDPATRALPNNFSPNPTKDGYPLGPLTYFKKKFPAQILHAATIIADLPATIRAWHNEKAAMEHLGYHVLADPALPPTQTDFTQQIVAMKNAGVQILFLEQEPQNYASAIFRDLRQQNFHPVVVLGTPSYSKQLVVNSGGADAVDGAYLTQASSLFLGEDAGVIPAISTFNTWVQKVSPGFPTDFTALEGWLCAELFVDALRSAGSNPTRGSVLQALRHITSFSSGNLIPVSNPAGKVPITCYLIGQVVGGAFQRLDDPPVSGPTHGYRCDQPYYSTS